MSKRQGGRHADLPGYHGKGLYSGQGRVVYANNGDHAAAARTNPAVPSGALAEWDGMSDAWTVVRRNQFTEVSGPGGVYGNANPEADPLWTIGWDHRSLILMVRQDGRWQAFRLPKSSHSDDGAHGWNTEWQRIRDIGEDDLLMTMHGALWRFPRHVDASVASALVHKAGGDQLVAVFVDTGLLRKNEGEQVASAFRNNLHSELIAVDASNEFFSALAGITEPEQKRKIVGEKFIRTFEVQAKQLGQPKFLVQGTIYPDVVESSAPDRNKAEKIKTHHNVGGLPEDMQFELVEPLRYLFKDEVRAVGEALGLPESLVWRQPFPVNGSAGVPLSLTWSISISDH